MMGWRSLVPHRVRRVAGRMRDRLRSAAVVLLYHRVVHLDADPWALAVRPERFREHLDVLARCGRVRALGDLATTVAAGRAPGRSVVLTFDDGYADFRTAALPELERVSLPATLFVTTGGVDRPAEFWWDQLERIVLRASCLPPELELTIGGERRCWSVGDDGPSRVALYATLHPLLGRLAADARADALAALGAWASVPAEPRPTHRSLSASELADVAASPLIEVGAHSVSHPYLTALPVAEQRREIETSRAQLEAIAGPVRHFSYPHGDCTADTIALVRAAGFAAACGTACRAVHGGSDVFALPRVEVPDLGGADFERWLGEWC